MLIFFFRGNKLGIIQVSFCVLIVFLLSLSEAIFGFFLTLNNGFVESEYLNYILTKEYHLSSPSDLTIPLPYVGFSGASFTTIFYCIYGSSLVMMAFSSSIYYGFGVYNQLLLQKGVMALKTIRLHKQITNIMLIQVSSS